MKCAHGLVRAPESEENSKFIPPGRQHEKPTRRHSPRGVMAIFAGVRLPKTYPSFCRMLSERNSVMYP